MAVSAANTGNGGDAEGTSPTEAGGSGIVIVRYIPGLNYGPNTNLPFYEDFEAYPTNFITSLDTGVNGWYGSSSNIIVQTNIVRTGTNAAMIPVNCTLSNRFTGIPHTNVWIQMDVQPRLYNGTISPVVNTNKAGMFYINSNGNFVVHDGVASPDPTNSVNWVTLTNGGIGTNGTNWVTIGIYEDFTRKKWDLYTNGVLVTNNIKFVNPALTNFGGVDDYNGKNTSYLDNVSVTVSNRTAGYIGLSTAPLTYTATYTPATSNQTQTVVMTNLGQSAFTYSNTVSYGSGGSGWLTVTPVVGELAGSATQVLTGTVNSSNLNVGVYMATNTISSPGTDATNVPQTIVATLTITPATQAAITFAPTTPQTYNTTNGLSASGGSGTGTFSYAVISGPGSVAGTNLTATSGTGTIVVRATKAADDNYNAATQDFNVAAQLANQTINFPAIPAQPSGNLFLTLSATASSGLTVSFTNTSVLGTNIVGSLLTFNGAGVYTMMASQTGNLNYAAAAPVSNTFPVYNSGQAGTSNSIPWSDKFETYYNIEPLINGTNGWYGSSANIIVQTNIVATGIYITNTGTQAAMIPLDCTLSNRFVAGTPFNVRIAMDVRPAHTDFAETNFPPVDTNSVALFYVDTNGHFVVCNGSGTTSTWCMVSNAVGSGSEFIATNDAWATLVIYLDYRHRNWKLKANNILITNKIGFVTQQTNGFRGFEVFNNNSTSYLDNVYVNWWDRFKVNGVLDHLIRSVNGVIPDRIMGVPTP